MIDYCDNLSKATVRVSRPELLTMVRLIRLLDRLSRHSAYRECVYASVPEVASFDPGHDAVMMCYDFHLTAEGPRLIEVNTNAGGGLLAYLAHQPVQSSPLEINSKLKNRLLAMFSSEMQQFSGGKKSKPNRIVIIDETPEQQYLYGEMQAFASLLTSSGIPTEIAEPHQLKADADGITLNGAVIDMIYNRHCDFYLESENLAGVRSAYLNHSVCLTPNPHMYGLLADKRRLVLWSDPELISQMSLSATDQKLLTACVPPSFLLADLSGDEVWRARKSWVFKPVTRFGSRGVLLGAKISRSRFNKLLPEETLVQQLALPSLTEVPEYGSMKTDLRLYAYRGRVLGVTARLYQGQVTNLRTPGGGFAPIKTTL